MNRSGSVVHFNIFYIIYLFLQTIIDPFCPVPTCAHMRISSLQIMQHNMLTLFAFNTTHATDVLQYSPCKISSRFLG